MSDDKIRLPSGQGGLTRFGDETLSKFQLSPGAVVVFCLIIMIMIILLHVFGKGLI